MILAAIMACICLVSCGGGDYAGKWELYEMSSGGMTFKDSVFGVPVAIMFQFEFKDDGTGTIVQNDDEEKEQNTLTWKEKGDGISVTMNGEDVQFNKDGEYLVAEYKEDGKEISMKLVKVDEFTKYDPSTNPFASSDE